MVYFHKIVNFSNLSFDPSLNPIFYNKLLYILTAMEQKGLYVEPLLMEPWKFGNIMTMWWTNTTLQNQISFFYRTFTSWLKEIDLHNVVYITLWSEASYYLEWTDGYYVVTNNLACYSQANSDWINWLSNRGVAPVNLSLNTIKEYLSQYIDWSQTTFIKITQLKAQAVKSAWPEMLTSSEMGYPNGNQVGVGGAYCPSAYLDLCANMTVNILNDHDYFDSTWWSQTPYFNATTGRVVVCNEIGPPFFLGVYANDTQNWWYYMEPKMSMAVKYGSGFAIWTWMDYDNLPWGLNDINGEPRPVLQMIKQWLANQNIEYFNNNFI
jgi:hypothetical protein